MPSSPQIIKFIKPVERKRSLCGVRYFKVHFRKEIFFSGSEHKTKTRVRFLGRLNAVRLPRSPNFRRCREKRLTFPFRYCFFFTKNFSDGLDTNRVRINWKLTGNVNDSLGVNTAHGKNIGNLRLNSPKYVFLVFRNASSAPTSSEGMPTASTSFPLEPRTGFRRYWGSLRLAGLAVAILGSL